MIRDYPGEKWKIIELNFDSTTDSRIEVSNFGRLKSFNTTAEGKILKGAMVNGYSIIRLKLYKPRAEEIQKRFDYLQQQALQLTRSLKLLKANNESEEKIKQTTELLKTFKKSLSEKFQNDLNERTIHYHSLVHRLVASYFLPKPAPDQTVVAHLDYNKLNNRASNLRWMTREENFEHQQNSPNVKNEKQERKHRRKEASKATKLTVTKVMLLKKLLKEDKPMKQLVKQFRITHTQILRIKRGTNWADIEPAQ